MQLCVCGGVFLMLLCVCVVSDIVCTSVTRYPIIIIIDRECIEVVAWGAMHIVRLYVDDSYSDIEGCGFPAHTKRIY
jgi:hypothetical protein